MDLGDDDVAHQLLARNGRANFNGRLHIGYLAAKQDQALAAQSIRQANLVEYDFRPFDAGVGRANGGRDRPRFHDAQRIRGLHGALAAQSLNNGWVYIGQIKRVTKIGRTSFLARAHRLLYVGNLSRHQDQVMSRLNGAGDDVLQRRPFHHGISGGNTGGDAIEFK
jgi:hypothetical protein